MIEALLSSYFTLNAALQQTSRIFHTPSRQEERSFFYYTDPLHAQGKLYLGDIRLINTQNVSQQLSYRIYPKMQGCVISTSTFDRAIQISDETSDRIDFTLEFAAPCAQDELQLDVERVITNSITHNGNTYEAERRESLGTWTIKNKLSTQNIVAILESDDGSNKMGYGSTKQITYRLVDTQGREIDPERIRSLKIRTLDSSKLLVVDENGRGVVSSPLGHITSFGTFRVRSLRRSGLAKVAIEVELESGMKKEFYYPLFIESLPLQQEKIVLSFSKDSIKPWEINSFVFSLLDDERLIPVDNIEKIELSIEHGFLLMPSGIEATSFLLRPVVNTKAIYFKAIDVHNPVRLTVKAWLKNGERLQRSLTIPVREAASGRFNIVYLGTDYNDTLHRFDEQFLVSVASNEDLPRVAVDVVTPKIYYPDIYYTNIFFVGYDPTQSGILYEDRGYQIATQNVPSGKLERQGSNSYFKSDRFDFDGVVPGQDRLVVLPNKYMNDPRYLGGWDIARVVDEHTLQLANTLPGSVDRVSFVIGDNSRYNPRNDSIVYFSTNAQNGLSLLNNEAVLHILYPPFFIGRDIFIAVRSEEEGVGNTYKRTLTGRSIAPVKFQPCEDAVCRERVKLVSQDSNTSLVYTHFATTCQMEKAEHYYFTDANHGCVGRQNYNGAVENQTTDIDGRTYLCIYPKPKYEERQDRDTNMTYQVLVGYEKVEPKCQFSIAEEFPY